MPWSYQTPYYNPYYVPQAYYGGDYIPQRIRYRYGRQTASMFSDINDLEKYALNKNFLRDSDRTRLERLEMQAFGAVQQGDMYTRYDRVRNAILTRPQQNYKKSLLRNIGEYVSGQLTGFTPSINDTDYDYSSSNYGMNTNSSYISPYGRRFSTGNYGISSGAGVKILD